MILNKIIHNYSNNNNRKIFENINANYDEEEEDDADDDSGEDEEQIMAPIAKLDLDEWLDIMNDSTPKKNINNYSNSSSNNNCNNTTNSNSNGLKSSIDLCSSLEDLVKTFDKNVKECFTNYKNIDIGQLAPVQVRSQEDIINDSQIWYTLTGNFGNLLPIDYWYKSSSSSLIKKYHNQSLNLKKSKSSIRLKLKKRNYNQEQTEQQNYESDIDNYESLFNDEDDKDCEVVNDEDDFDDDDDDDDDEDEDDGCSTDETDDEDIEGSNPYGCNYNGDFISKQKLSNNNINNTNQDGGEYLDFDEEEELKEQLDMHSMILSKSVYNDSDLDEPIITAEQVLNEIDSMMTMQEEYLDEMTPDSGCYSTAGLNSSLSSNSDIPIDVNGSYIKYINTFALHTSNSSDCANNTVLSNSDSSSIDVINSCGNLIQLDMSFIPSKTDLKKLNIYELNEIIEQIENNTKELSDTLVQELSLKDELEFEKETRNTFITLLMSIQDKRRQLNSDNNSIANCKKKNRKSLVNINLDCINNSTYLTTIIPYNNQMEYTVQHLQILNKLLKAINEDSHQVPELLTNYILKVVCPT